MLTVSVLGPISVSLDGDTVEVSGARMRAVLAVLIVHLNEVVSTDRLLEEAWNGAPPRSGINALRVQINSLRSLLGSEADALETASPGYTLNISEESVDATRYEATVTMAEHLKDSDPERASQLLDEAENLWRGEPYPDVEGEFADVERRRFAVIRESARSCRFEVELHLGRHQRVLAEVDDALEAAPYEERLWRSKMIALYRDGRHAEALRTFRSLGDLLADIGLEPSPESGEIELQILNHDPLLNVTRQRVSNVPVPTTSFIGRRDLVDRVVGASADARCVSLLGTGGIGKTRMAIEAAHEIGGDFPGGTWFVDLTTLRDPDTVPIHCASQLGLFIPSGSSAVESLQRWASSTDRLLIVDNCERVTKAAAGLITALLKESPTLRVITTSRVRLGIPGEQIVQLTPMHTNPENAAASAPSDAAALLFERAIQADAQLDPAEDLETIEALARLLEGMPLALELAAAKLRHMTPTELLRKLEGHFGLLVDPSRSDSPHRRALNATLEWSWDLLGEDARTACSALSLFRGGFTSDAADAILGDVEIDTNMAIAELIDASLLNMRVNSGTARFSFLESVRLFAIGSIPLDLDSTYRRRHAEYFADVAVASHLQLRSSEQGGIRAALIAESANLKAAILYAVQLGDDDLEVKIAANAGNFWFETGQLDLGRTILTKVLDHQDPSRSTSLLSDLCRTLIELCIWSGAVEEAERFLEYEAALVDSLHSPIDATELLGSRALFSFITGDYALSCDEMSMMLVDDAPDKGIPRAYAAASTAYLLLRMGRREESLEAIEQAVLLGRDFGQESVAAMRADFNGWLAFHDGYLAAAEWEWSIGERAYESLELYPMMADMRQLRAWAGITRGDELAPGLLASANGLMAQYGLRPFVVRGNILMAAANATSEPRLALDHLRKELENAARIRLRTAAMWSLVYAARCQEVLGEHGNATNLADAANRLRSKVPIVWPGWLTDEILLQEYDPDTNATDQEIISRALESF